MANERKMVMLPLRPEKDADISRTLTRLQAKFRTSAAAVLRMAVELLGIKYPDEGADHE